MTTLEEIADKLIEGKITSAEAEKMCNGMKLSFLEFSEEIYDVPEIESPLEDLEYSRNNSVEQAPLQLRDLNELKSEIRYSFAKDSEGDRFVFINRADAFEEGQGYFGKLFRQLIDISLKYNVKYIELEVEKTNEHAIEVYNHLEFVSLGKIFDKPKYYSMRKDLD